MIEQLKLVIFDLDGVILNSEPIHTNTRRRILDELGLYDTGTATAVGFPMRVYWSNIAAKNNLTIDLNKMIRKYDDYNFEGIIKNKITASEGLIELLDLMDSHKIRAGIASSSTRYFIESVLNHLDIKDRFSTIVSCQEVPVPKPAPDVYLEVVKKEKVKSQESIAIEDSMAGVTSAVSAGLVCFGYVNPTSGNQDLSKAQYRIKSLSEVSEFIKKMHS